MKHFLINLIIKIRMQSNLIMNYFNTIKYKKSGYVKEYKIITNLRGHKKIEYFMMLNLGHWKQYGCITFFFFLFFLGGGGGGGERGAGHIFVSMSLFISLYTLFSWLYQLLKPLKIHQIDENIKFMN